MGLVVVKDIETLQRIEVGAISNVSSRIQAITVYIQIKKEALVLKLDGFLLWRFL
jgi:hypothetical protein